MYVRLYIFSILHYRQCGPIFVVYRQPEAFSVLTLTNEWLISQDEDLESLMIKIPHDIIKFNTLVNSFL